MNKNIEVTSENAVKRGRGRPRKELALPTVSFFTVNDLVALNPQIECRLSVYTRCTELVKKGVIRYSGKTQPTGGVGKPLDVFQTMASFRRSRAAKRAAKTRKNLAKITVDLTPAPAPVQNSDVVPA